VIGSCRKRNYKLLERCEVKVLGFLFYAVLRYLCKLNAGVEDRAELSVPINVAIGYWGTRVLYRVVFDGEWFD